MSKDSFRQENWLNRQKFKLSSLFASILPKKKNIIREKDVLRERDEMVAEEKNKKNGLNDVTTATKDSAAGIATPGDTTGDTTGSSAISGLPNMSSAPATGSKSPGSAPLSGIKVNSPRILETNLIQGEVVSFFDWRRSFIILAIFVAISVFVIGGIYGYLFIWERIKIEEGKILEDDYNNLQADITKLKNEVKDVTSFEKKLIMANILIDRHIYWSKFFEFLEKNTLSDVYYDSFAGDYSGTYTFKAHGKNFHTIAAQMELLRSSDLVEEVEVTGGSLGVGINGEDEVSFDFNIVINPKVFLK